LKNQLPEIFSVFNSGGDNESEKITIMPVSKNNSITCSIMLVLLPSKKLQCIMAQFIKSFLLIKRHVIKENETLIRASISDYINTCNELINGFENDPNTSIEWYTFRHGQHIRFTNKKSEQIVEVPIFEISKINQVDPYFWGEFVASTEKYSSINNLIKHTFPDSARILDYFVMKNIREDEKHNLI